MTTLAALMPVEQASDRSSRPAPACLDVNSGDAPAALANRLITHHNFFYQDTQFRVSLFEGSELTRQASSLLERAYTRLGYVCDCSQAGIDAGVTLQAAVENRVVGTLSVTLDSARGIQAQSLYASEIAHFRQRGKICEFTRLATDTAVAGREVLCSLFYVAYVYAHLVHGVTDLFVEVNPRHASFYKRMLGFQQRGDAKLCPRVGAPAVLLHLDFRYTALQIERARSGLSVDSSKLYQHASAAEEERLLVEGIRDEISS